MCSCNQNSSASAKCGKNLVKMKTFRNTLLTVYKTETRQEVKVQDAAIIGELSNLIAQPEWCVKPQTLSSIETYVNKRVKEYASLQ